MRGRTIGLAAAAVALMLAVKLLLVYSLADVFFYGEELEKGTAAKAMLDGLPVRHHTLAYHYYEGGGFTVSHLTALAFLAVGPNLLAHKLVSLAFNTAMLLVGLAFVRRSFGLASAAVFGLLFTFAPPGVQKLSLLNLGIHYESLLFLLALFLLASRLLDGTPSRRATFGLGLVAGFGAFFSYQTLPLTAFLVVLLLVRRREVFAAGRELAFGWGLVLGAAPLLAMWRRVGSEVFDIHGTQLVGGGGASLLQNVQDAGVFVRTLLVGGGPIQHVRFLLAAALPVVGLLLLRRPADDGARRARTVYLALLGYAAVYGALYLNSPFVVREVTHHFLLQRTVPFWMVGILLASAVVGRLLAAPSGNRRMVGALALLALVAHGVEGTVDAVREGRPGRFEENHRILSEAKGYTYAEYFAKFLRHLPGKPETRLAVALRFDEPERALLRADAANALWAKSDQPLDEILAILRRASPTSWRDFLPGLGPYFFRMGNNRMENALYIVARAPAQLRPALFEALGRRGLHMRSRPEALQLELEDLEGESLPPSYYRGFGHRVYLGFRLDPEAGEAFLASVPERYREMVRRGYELAREQRTLPTAPSR